MRAARSLAVAAALLALLATAGCGLGEGEEVGDATLTVTRDYGSRLVLSRSLTDLNQSDTVLRTLDRSAEITTRYGGGFVQSVDGLAGRRSDGRPYDWFFYVNGVESSVGAADVPLRGGERIWWDYRDWTGAMRVPAVVGSFPEPFRSGYEGKRRSTAVICRAAAGVCGTVRGVLRQVGARFAGEDRTAIRVLVGTWSKLRRDPAAAQIENGPQSSGVFADFLPASGGLRLAGLNREGGAARRFGAAAGLVAATRRFDGPPVWVLTGATPAGVRAAVDGLSAAALRDDYAVAFERGQTIPLPVR